MKKSKITGIIGTLAVHVLVVALLLLLNMVMPEKQEEGGVPVMLGDTELAQGSSDPYNMTEVDILPATEAVEPEMTDPVTEVEQPMITQKDEPSMVVKEEKSEDKKKKAETEVKEHPKKPV